MTARTPWTGAEESLLAAIYEGPDALTMSEIHQRLPHHPPASIRTRVQTLGLRRDPVFLARQGYINAKIKRDEDEEPCPRAIAGWPDHRFEDDPRAVAEPHRPLRVYVPEVRSYMGSTLGGVG